MNYNFPADRWWRQKYNIPFFSKQHLDASQLDIAREYQEMLIFKEFQIKAEQIAEKEENYKKGIWITQQDPINEKEIDLLFDSIDISQFNNEEHGLQIEE